MLCYRQYGQGGIMSNTCLRDLMVYIVGDSNTCELTTLSNYVVIVEIILHHYPCNVIAQNAKQELIKKLNDRLNEMFEEKETYYD